MTDRPQDDLDMAEIMIKRLNDAATDDESVSYSLAAIAHTMMWNAKQHREVLRMQAAAVRAAEEWRKTQPPPPPPMSYPFNPGF